MTELAIVNGIVFGAPGATTVAIEGGRITAVGGRETGAGARETVDARGGLVMPGFDDAHIHLLGGAREAGGALLYPLETLEEVQAVIRAHAAAHPEHEWVLGRGWLYAAFPGGMPTAAQLDDVVPDRPAWIGCFDGHTSWANTRAMELAGITRETPDPPAGVIVRDAEGNATGAFKEEAQALIDRLVPKPTEREDREAVRRALAGMHALGLTAAQDAWLEPDELAFWERVHADGELALRFRGALIMTPDQSLAEWRDRLDAYEAQAFPLRGGDHLCSGILKGFVDGVVDSRTAALLAPYEGDTSTGLPAWEPRVLDAFVAEADRRGWQVELHAIGDRGVRLALDAYEHAARANGPWAGDPHGRGTPPGTHRRRHRVEHVEMIDPADVPRFGALGVIASMQPYHGDPTPSQIGPWAANIGPARARSGWSWRSIREAGGVLAFGSDWPVVPYDPFIALNNAVNRTTTRGLPEGGWSDERLTLPQAIEAYTAGSAFAAYAEHRRGRVTPGLDADVIVLHRDLLAAGPSAIIGTGVALTVLAGRIVHRSEALA
ncbi:MAG TPA: amidohydrolase [Candidatus Limnocylindrales bacterium]|nr:amidohydrolase [Candidatus Limnocylindrales bacterium]